MPIDQNTHNGQATISVKHFLREIKPVIERARCIQGFVITSRTDKSTVQIKWGSNRITRYKSPVHSGK